MSVERMLERLLGLEGKYSNNPDDTGGEAMWGITRRIARTNGWAGAMQNLPRDIALRIYRTEYYEKPGFAKIAEMSESIAEELFDTGVNCGQETASKFLQRALNACNNQERLWPDVVVDGHIGPRTLDAFKSYLFRRNEEGEKVMLRILNGLQLAHYMAITESRPKNETFFYGWVRARVE